MGARLKREATIAIALIAFGLLLPVAIYFVGTFVIGPYDGDGLMGLLATVWGRMAAGDWAAWMLVLSPYIVIQLFRLSWRALRGRKPVSAVTVSAQQP